MMNKNPDQLHIYVDKVDPLFQKLCDELGINSDEVDRRANNLGSYGDAWRSFGASQQQIDELYRGPLSEVSSDGVDADDSGDVKTIETGASVSILGKASNLLYASDNLAKENSLRGLIYAIETGHPSVRGKFYLSDIIRLRVKADRCKNIGKNALRNAYGDPEALIAVGFDRATVEADMNNNEEEFEGAIIGPENKKNLAKFRKYQKSHFE